MPGKDLQNRLSAAVQHFWRTRTRQGEYRGSRTGKRDAGNRTAATGGKQLDGITNLLRDLLVESGLPASTVFCGGRENVTLPGYFRPTKQWDLVVVSQGRLLASIECKALCGPSFGNNYNNRIEEALGSAADLWTAFREGAFEDSPRPFLGYVLLLEQADASIRGVSVLEKHFQVFDAFQGASYARRCEVSLRRLVRERSYDAAALILTSREDGPQGKFSEPAHDLVFDRFVTLLCSQVRGSYLAVAESHE